MIDLRGSKMRSKLTYHGRHRVSERVTRVQNKVSLVGRASRLGKTKNMYFGKFHQYLDSKSKNGKIKVYQEYIYILTKNSRKLITVYPVPRKYLPTEQYEITKELYTKTMKINSHVNEEVIITTKDGMVVRGTIKKEFIPTKMRFVSLHTGVQSISFPIDDIVEIISLTSIETTLLEEIEKRKNND